MVNRESTTHSRTNRATTTPIGSVSKHPAGADEAAGIAVASRGRTGPATRRVFRRASSTAGLYEAEETARRSFRSADGRQPSRHSSNWLRLPRAQFEECVIEFESSSGSKMRIQWKATTSPDWTACCGPGGKRRMIQITAQMRVLVAIEAVDGRKGIDSLARLCQEKLAGRSFLRMRVCVSEPQRNGDPTAQL